jgi:NTE family protein
MDARSTLQACPLFAGVSEAALDWLAARATMLPIGGGETLFAAGAIPTDLHIVAAGRLRALRPDGSTMGDVVRLEPVGEIGLLTGEPRHASVYALRDSLLLKISGPDWLQFAQDHPSALLETTRVIIRRMRQTTRQSQLGGARASQTFAILPAHSGALATEMAHALVAALSTFAPTQLIDARTVDAVLGAGAATAADGEDSDRRLLSWLSEREHQRAYLVYLADEGNTAWTRRCLRQADRVLVAADVDTPPIGSPTLDLLRQSPPRVAVELLLRRPDGSAGGEVLAWRTRAQARAHYFLRPGDVRDYTSLARQLCGRGIGLVLGGGGARGFAHIGLIRALEELEIPVDIVGGTSMGAFFAALRACGTRSVDMQELARQTFVANNYMNDFVLPRVALIRGRKFLQRLHVLFGDRRIEDLRMPFFCMSTNLTRATSVTHDHGPLYMWVGTSMSVPGVAPPMVWHGELLADGAVLNALPTDIMQSLGRGPIIASDVNPGGGPRLEGVEGPDPEALLRRERGGITLIDLLFRSATLSNEHNHLLHSERAEVYMRMPVAGVAVFDWKRLDDVVERGYRHALETLGPKRELLLSSGVELRASPGAIQALRTSAGTSAPAPSPPPQLGDDSSPDAGPAPQWPPIRALR